jgi:acyl-CoA reductase-like NAD-dependent aldehyde dehydrogenase
VRTWLQASGGARPIRAPADGTEVGRLPTATDSDVTAAVEAARRALEAWRTAAPHARAAVLRRGAERLRSRVGELAPLHAQESGKVLVQARKEVLGAAELLEANAFLGRYTEGVVAPTGGVPGFERDLTWIERVPLGVIVCVIPFNFPVELTIEKAGAALASGNVAIVKPPPRNPLATARTVEILVEAGLPEGVLQLVPGGADVGAALCSAPGVDAVSLTGSVGAGIAVATATAQQLRPLHLELGGNGASVVLPDADLSHVVAEAIRGRTLMNGQACAATKRVVVERSLASELTERLDEALGNVRMGDPLDESSELGPLIDASAAARVATQVDRALEQGATLVRGSTEVRDAWFAPSLLAEVPADADVARDDEIFGPVATVIPVAGDDEAVRVVNSSKLGLTAAVFSADLPRAIAVAQRLEVGGVVVNGTNNYRPPVVPFGGVGMAGHGREGLGYSYEELTRTRFIALRGVRPPATSIEDSDV